MPEISTPSFHLGRARKDVGSGYTMSPLKIFRVCKRIRKWWRREDLYLRRLPGLYSIWPATAQIAELCPWVSWVWGRGGQRPAVWPWHLPRDGVEMYQLSHVRFLQIELFFVFFDWHSGKDVLGLREWAVTGKQRMPDPYLRLAAEVEWRAAKLAKGADLARIRQYLDC